MEAVKTDEKLYQIERWNISWEIYRLIMFDQVQRVEYMDSPEEAPCRIHTRENSWLVDVITATRRRLLARLRNRTTRSN